jgi:hypothetical protein
LQTYFSHYIIFFTKNQPISGFKATARVSFLAIISEKQGSRALAVFFSERQNLRHRKQRIGQSVEKSIKIRYSQRDRRHDARLWHYAEIGERPGGAWGEDRM